LGLSRKTQARYTLIGLFTLCGDRCGCSFRIADEPTLVAHVEFAARIMADGKVLDAKVFHATAPATAIEAPAAARALDAAFGKAATDLRAVGRGGHVRRGVARHPAADLICLSARQPRVFFDVKLFVTTRPFS
jgi:hypothetical protein